MTKEVAPSSSDMEGDPQPNVSWRNIMDTADAEAIKRDTPAPPIHNHHQQQQVTLSPVSKRLFKGRDGGVGTGTPTTVTPPQTSTGTPVPPVPPVLVPPPLLDQPLHQPALGGGGNPSYSAMISPRGTGGGGGGFLRVNMAGTVDSNTTASGTDGSSTYKYLHEDASQDPYQPLGQAQTQPPGSPGGRGAAVRQLKLKKWKEESDGNPNTAPSTTTTTAALYRGGSNRGRSPGPRNESFNKPTNSGGNDPHQSVVVPNKMTTASGHSTRISDLTMNTGDGGSSLEFATQAARSSVSGQQQQQEANVSGGAMPSIVENSMNSGAFHTATTKDSLPPESAGAASVATSSGLRFSEQLDTPHDEPRSTAPANISKEDEAAGMATTLNALKNIKMSGMDDKNKEEEEKKRQKRERLIWIGDHIPVCLGPTLVCVLIALIVVNSVRNGGDGSDTTLPPSATPIPTIPPTSLSLTRHESQLYSFINEMIQSPQSRSYSSYLDTSKWIQDKTSPQFQAFSWLLYDPLFESLLQDEQDRKLSELRGATEEEESALVAWNSQERSLQRASASINLASFLSSHQRQVVMQRFAMATFYYATGGPNWKRSSNWLSEQPVCSWYVNNFGRQCLTTSGDGDYKDDQRDIGDFITSLELDNNELQGTLPNELAILSDTLHTLILSNNSLSGSLPAFLLGRTLRPGNDEEDDDSAILRTLHLDQNQLSGSIPSEWVDMDDGDDGGIPVISRLEDLRLNDNMLSGMVPTEFWRKATSLVEVNIGGNPQLGGSIPTEIGNLISLRAFHGQDMAWVGSLPSEIGTCFQLRELNLSQSERLNAKADMEGSIPSEVWELPRLRHIDLEGLNLRGRLPKIGQLVFLTSTLRSIRLGRNKLQGTISTMFGLLTNLETLELQYNELGEGGTSNSQSNEFLPAVPTELGSLTMLTTFNLSNNPNLGLSSPIRDIGTEFGKLVKLQELNLSSCGLVSSIPRELGLLTELRELLLDGNNQWTGTVPMELGQLTLLEKLHIGSDVGIDGDDFFARLGLVGTIPEQVLNGLSSTLKSLVLPNNQFTGALPATLANFSKLTHLDLSNNQFTSTLPTELAILTKLGEF